MKVYINMDMAYRDHTQVLKYLEGEARWLTKVIIKRPGDVIAEGDSHEAHTK
jgi:hypothetical protein